MSTLTGKKLSVNIYSKPGKNLKNECLHDRMHECLDKSSESGFEIVPIFMDCHATNVKVMKKLLKLISPATNEKPTLFAQMKFETSVLHNNNEHFMFLRPSHAEKIQKLIFFIKQSLSTS